MKVLISFLQNTGRPWDLFIVSGYLFLFLFMCSGHPWQFFIACWTWCIKNKFVDMTHPVMIYSFKEESLSLCCANRGVVESSNPIKILLKWGWFEALISLRQSLNCLWPFRVLIWNSFYQHQWQEITVTLWQKWSVSLGEPSSPPGLQWEVRQEAVCTVRRYRLPSAVGWRRRARENGSRGRRHAWVTLCCGICTTAAWWIITARPVPAVTHGLQGNCHAVKALILLVSELLGSRGPIVTAVTLVPSQAPSRERSVEFKLNAFECSAQPVTARHLFEVSDSINI